MSVVIESLGQTQVDRVAVLCSRQLGSPKVVITQLWTYLFAIELSWQTSINDRINFNSNQLGKIILYINELLRAVAVRAPDTGSNATRLRYNSKAVRDTGASRRAGIMLVDG